MFEQGNGQRRRSKEGGSDSLLTGLKRWYVDPQSLTPPPGAGSGRTETVLSGRDLIEIDGCRGLEIYREDEIAVRIKEGILSVRGQNLELKIYRGSRIAVIGRIDAAIFSGGKENGGRKE